MVKMVNIMLCVSTTIKNNILTPSKSKKNFFNHTKFYHKFLEHKNHRN